ncbi:nucleoside deaminase [Bartonella sp. DGB1]|uniref:nucleoside deaminase n=1 Tax=Bartonella sp. DGB1 TaxID=3239807 RepID=UPI003523A470
MIPITANFTFMEIALQEAEKAQKNGEVPVGAIIVKNNKIIATANNQTRSSLDPSAHAEIVVIRKACKILKTDRLINCDLYVTLEPCNMCSGAISFARIRRLYYATPDPKGGAVENGTNFFSQKSCFHSPEIYSCLSQNKSQLLLKNFFKQKR